MQVNTALDMSELAKVKLEKIKRIILVSLIYFDPTFPILKILMETN